MHRLLRLVPLQAASDTSDLLTRQRLHDFPNLLLRKPLLSLLDVGLRFINFGLLIILPLPNLLLHCFLELRLLNVVFKLVRRHLCELVDIDVHTLQYFEQLLVLLSVRRNCLIHYNLFVDLQVMLLLAVVDYMLIHVLAHGVHLRLHLLLHNRALL